MTEQELYDECMMSEENARYDYWAEIAKEHFESDEALEAEMEAREGGE